MAKNNKTNKNTVCQKVFDSEQNLSRHLQEIHTNLKAISKVKSLRGNKISSKKLVCKFCSKIYKTKYAFEIHLRDHTTERFYTCYLCEKSYKNSSEFNNHLETHSSQLPANGIISIDTDDSDGCQSDNGSGCLLKNSTQQISLNTHEENVKEEIKKEFLDNELLENANKTSNLVKDPTQQISIKRDIKDNICSDEDEEEFLDNNSIPLAMEARSDMDISKTEYTYDLSIINTAKRLENKSNAIDNDAITDLLTEYVCEICFKSFAQLHHLKSHLRIHTDVCKKTLKKVESSNGGCTIKANVIKEPKLNVRKKKATRHNILVNKSEQEIINLSTKSYNKDSNDSPPQVQILNNTTKKLRKIKITQIDNKCAICNKMFSFQRDLLKHAHDIHPGTKALKCRECNERFIDRSALSCHFTVHKMSPKQSVCDNRTSKTKEIQILSIEFLNESQHPKNKSNEDQNSDLINNFDHSSDEMDLEENSNANNSEVDNNEVMVKSGSKNFKSRCKKLTLADNKCTICNKIFNFQRDLTKHAKQYHPNEKALKCCKCSLRFRNIRELTHHSKMHFDLQKKRNRFDSLLKKYFKYNISMNNHQKIHLENLRNKLDLNDKTQIENNLRANDDNTIKKKYKCEFCTKSYEQNTALKIHLRKHTGERPFSCSMCSKSFYTKGDMNKHKSSHSVERPHTCSICNKSFKTKDNLNRHLKIHSEERPYSCSLCSKSFKRKYNLKRHLAWHSNVSEKSLSNNLILKTSLSELYKSEQASKKETFKARTYFSVNENQSKSSPKKPILTDLKCAVCKKMFKFQRDVVKHVRQYHLKAKALKCRNCSVLCNNIRELMHHNKIHKKMSKKNGQRSLSRYFLKEDFKTNISLNNHHVEKLTNEHDLNDKTQIENNLRANDDNTIKKKYKCEFCTKSYEQNTTLKIHLRKHTGERPFSCLMCSKSFYTKADMNEHKSSHSVERSHTCSICNKSFKTKKSLNRHLKIHSGERLFSCSICSKSFQRIEHLQRHAVVHNEERRFACSLCDKKFKHKTSLDNHKKFHIDEESRTKQKEFACKLCSKSFDKANNLRIHLRQHNGRFTCEYCSKSYYHQYKLDIHLRVHTGERPYSCSLCSKSFKRTYSLKRHLAWHSNVSEKSLSNNLILKTSLSELYKSEQASKKETFKARTYFSVNENQSKSSQKKPILTDLKCAVCKKMFKFQRDVVKHARQYHLKAKALKCRNCSVLCNNIRELMRHNKIHKKMSKKNGQRSLSRYFLKEDFKTNISLNNHHVEKLTNEHDLNDKTQIENNLRANDDNTIKKKYKCEFCTKSYEQNTTLKIHLRKHTGERPFSCSMCSKSFYTKGDMNKHKSSHSVERSHTCSICNKSFKRKDYLNRHLKIHSEERPYSCSLCSKSFKRKYNLKRHLAWHSNVSEKSLSNNLILKTSLSELYKSEQASKKETFKARTYFSVNENQSKSSPKKPILTDLKCAVCKKMFKFQRDVVKHARQYHLKAKALKCRNCSVLCNNIRELMRHNKIHKKMSKKNGQRSLSRYFLKEDFKTNISLNNHHVEKLTNEHDLNDKTQIENNLRANDDNTIKKKYKCEFCTKSYEQNTTLKIHLRKHTGERPFSCLMCSKSFYTKADMNEHKSSHSVERSHTCSICNKSFKTKKSLNRHLKIHSGERLFSCSICSKSFQRIEHLQRHAVVHNEERRFACSLCDKKFKHKTSLDNHKKFHIDEESRTKQKEFACKLCSKSFDKANNLRIHLRQHNGRFTCEYCSKSYYQQYHLNIHLRVHTGERPFVCSICSKSYKFKRDLKYHLKAHLRKGSNNCKKDYIDAPEDCIIKNPLTGHSKINDIEENNVNE